MQFSLLTLLLSFLLTHVPAAIAAHEVNKVKLTVPVVQQGKALCGPATLASLLSYWGEKRYDQYDIATSLINQFKDTKRIRESGILQTSPFNWNLYPGTGTINLREWLKRFGSVQNIMLEHEPTNKEEAERLFTMIKNAVAQGYPVIVHQYWSGPGSRGHYRLVTGFNEKKRIVFLNDTGTATRIEQSYDEFMQKWNVNKRWLHYNAIIFRPNTVPIRINI